LEIFKKRINSLLFFNVFLEFSTALISLFLLIIAYKKIRFSYWLFSLGCWLTPALTGTFSSMPRYILMMFLLLPILAKFRKKYFILLVVLLLSNVIAQVPSGLDTKSLENDSIVKGVKELERFSEEG